MINSTHLVKFEEKAVGSEYRSHVKTVSRTITRFSTDPQMENEKICIDKNKEPENLQVLITMFLAKMQVVILN